MYLLLHTIQDSDTKTKVIFFGLGEKVLCSVDI